jgi:pimeloyl-ACP methyl ester carboxylesterase
MLLQECLLRRTWVNGAGEFHYVEAGEGTPLVFVHGGFGDWQSWSPQWESFVPHFRCITYSRRHSQPNRNDPSAPYEGVNDDARDLASLLDAWHAAPAILVGTSYGAFTALVLAMHARHKVRALVLAEPPVLSWADRVPGGTTARRAFERDVLAPSREAFRSGNTEAAVRILAAGINGTAPGTSAVTPAGLLQRARNVQAMRALLAANDPFPDLDQEHVRRLDVATLLLAGERTEPIHDAAFQALCRVMTQARHARVPDCGHGSHRDNPAAFNEVALEFLRGTGL